MDRINTSQPSCIPEYENRYTNTNCNLRTIISFQEILQMILSEMTEKLTKSLEQLINVKCKVNHCAHSLVFKKQ